jgi:hypothetical protein
MRKPEGARAASRRGWRAQGLALGTGLLFAGGTVWAQVPRMATPGERLLAAAAVAGPVVSGRGQLLGYVSDATGRPAAGAVVEVRRAGLAQTPVERRTSAEGLFRLANLAPGTYYVQAGKGAQVAAPQQVKIRASERALLLIDLPRLLQSVQFGAPPGVHSDQAFVWALRQATIWGPILRLQPEERSSEPMAGYVALTAGAGSDAFESPDLATEFRVDSAMWGGGRVSLVGEVGTNGVGTRLGAGGDTRIQATFRPAEADNPSRLRVALRQVTVPGLTALPALRVMSVNYGTGINLGDRAEIEMGSLLEAVSMTNTMATIDPYVRAQVKVGAEGELEYRAAAAPPPVHFTGATAAMADPLAQVTLHNDHAQLEQALHQEVRYSDSISAGNTISAAVFLDHFNRTAINGAYGLGGAGVAAWKDPSLGGSLLPDVFNSMFLADGGSYGGWGYRVVLDHRLSDAWQADVGFADGPVLAPGSATWTGALAPSLKPVRAHAFTFKLAGVTPLTHTQVVCSYRALSRLAATGLDVYDDTGDASNSYANVYLKQPLPGGFGSGGRIAVLLEIHNLLAQGYIPMLGSDGRTLYLVQNARSLRGGLTFRF